MALSFLNEIVSVEEQAEQLESDALVKSREIVSAARKEALAATEKIILAAEAKGKEVVKSYEEKASADIQSMTDSVTADCEKLKIEAEAKLSGAVDYIVERVVNRNGNR